MDDQFKALFATAETGGKARLVSCVIGWSCEEVNAAQVEGYGLAAHIEIIAPGDGAALNADLIGAYEKGEPWLGYQWGTNEPRCCWIWCGSRARLHRRVLVHQQGLRLQGRHHPDRRAPRRRRQCPDVVAMLRGWTFDVTKYRVVADWLNNNSGADANDAALWWLSSNEAVWSTWVTEDAAEKIRRRARRRRNPRRLARGVVGVRASPRCAARDDASVAVAGSAGLTRPGELLY